MSYHPLLNDVILRETLKYFYPKQLKPLRGVHSSWLIIIDQSGIMKHQWSHTQKQLKQLNNIDKMTVCNEWDRSLCPTKGCFIFPYFDSDTFNVEFTDITKTYVYKYSIREDVESKNFTNRPRSLFFDIRVIPAEFCIEPIDHYLIQIKLMNCNFFVDYTDLLNLNFYICPYDKNQPFSKQLTYQHAYLGLEWVTFPLNTSSLTFLTPKFSEIIDTPGSNMERVGNPNYEIFITKHQASLSNELIIGIHVGTKLIQIFTSIDSWIIKGSWITCGKYLLVMTNEKALFYRCVNGCKKAFMFFKKYSSIEIRKVLTLSDYQILIVFNWRSSDRMGAYYVNINEKSVTEIKHQDELTSLLTVKSVTQLNNNVFMGLGYHQQFNQVIIDVENKKFQVFHNFAKVDKVDSHYR